MTMPEIFYLVELLMRPKIRIKSARVLDPVIINKPIRCTCYVDLSTWLEVVVLGLVRPTQQSHEWVEMEDRSRTRCPILLMQTGKGDENTTDIYYFGLLISHTLKGKNKLSFVLCGFFNRLIQTDISVAFTLHSIAFLCSRV